MSPSSPAYRELHGLMQQRSYCDGQVVLKWQFRKCVLLRKELSSHIVW